MRIWLSIFVHSIIFYQGGMKLHTLANGIWVMAQRPVRAMTTGLAMPGRAGRLILSSMKTANPCRRRLHE